MTVLSTINRWRMMVVFMVLPVITIADEISPLRFTNVDGFIALRYLYDENTTSSQSVVSKKELNPTFQEELALNTDAYVYHPNMLNMNLGGSLVYDQSSYETLDGKYSDDSTLTNYFAYLDFLEKKPYPLTLYYDQQNPSISSGLAGRFTQENVKYGFDFSLLEPFSPIQMTLGAFHQTFQGQGRDQIIDDVQEQASVRFYHAYGRGNFAELSHQINKFDSSSGSTNLPIQGRSYTNESTVLNSHNLYGEKNELKLSNHLSYSTRDEFPARDELSYNPNLTWRHSDSMNSFYRVDYSDTNEESQEIINRRLALGLVNTGANINADFDLHGENNDTTGVEYQNYGGIFSLTNQKPGSIGGLHLSYGGAYDRNDQQATVNLLQVFSEEHALIGTTPVDLLHQFIDVSTIIVRNASYTQDFVEGLDYRLIIIGSTVQIQRLTGGNILDGETVLVDYSYETGGTYAYEMIKQNIGLTFAFARYYDMYLRYLNSRQQLLEGEPTVELNSISRTMVGIHADRPLSNGMTLGGQASYENNNEDITSYIKQNCDAFIELPLPRLTDVRVSARRLWVDNENTEEDIDLKAYIVRISSQPGLRTTLSYETSYESDTGSSVDRLLQSHRLMMGWRIRQLTVTLSANYSIEEQGDIERERWLMKFIAKRKF